MDSTRSTPPPRALARHKEALTGSTRRTGAPLKYQIFEASSPGGPQLIEGIVARKPRPPTAHQLAVERNRSQRVEYILDKGIRKAHRAARKARKSEGAVVRAARRIAAMENPFDDSEGEDNVTALKHHILVGPSAYPLGVDPISGKKMPFRERGFGASYPWSPRPTTMAKSLLLSTLRCGGLCEGWIAGSIRLGLMWGPLRP